MVRSATSRPVRQRPKPHPRRLVESAALPPEDAAYPQILRGESYVWWRSVLGVVFGLSLFLLITTVMSQALVTLFWATTSANQSYRDYFSRAFAFELPLGMLSVNLGLAALIPVCVGSDGRNPSHAAKVAFLSTAADPLALFVRMPGDRRGRSERGDAAVHDGW